MVFVLFLILGTHVSYTKETLPILSPKKEKETEEVGSSKKCVI